MSVPNSAILFLEVTRHPDACGCPDRGTRIHTSNRAVAARTVCAARQAGLLFAAQRARRREAEAGR